MLRSVSRTPSQENDERRRLTTVLAAAVAAGLVIWIVIAVSSEPGWEPTQQFQPLWISTDGRETSGYPTHHQRQLIGVEVDR